MFSEPWIKKAGAENLTSSLTTLEPCEGHGGIFAQSEAFIDVYLLWTVLCLGNLILIFVLRIKKEQTTAEWSFSIRSLILGS